MNIMKDFLLNVCLLLGIAVIIAAVPTERESAIYEDTLRLHILASSDSERDQSVKYQIRDFVLKKYGERLSHFMSKAQAEAELENMCDDIRRDVKLKLGELGEEYGCRIEIGTEWYDTRSYESFTLPKGYYTSLRIILGEGDGQNWWCVM